MDGKLFSFRWFHDNISGEEAENLLLNKGRPGCFLVRDSKSSVGNFVLTIRKEDKVVKIRINKKGNFFNMGTGSEFASLHELISYYTIQGNVLTESDGQVIEAKHPFFVNDEFVTEKWFHGKIGGERAGTILKQDGKIHCFLVRERTKVPGEFVLSVLTAADFIVNVIIEYREAMYSIRAVKVSNCFKTLEELIEHYKIHPFTLQTGEDIIIGEPVLTTSIPSRPDTILQNLSSCEMKFENINEKLKTEFLELQQEEIKNVYNKIEGLKPVNKKKNRYQNILPYDHSRVVLKDGNPSIEGSDYINASHIQVDGCSLDFIATQGCLVSTISDFWRMIWHEDSNIIVMVTKNIESGKNKCEVYWPTKVDEPYDLIFYGASLRVEFLCIEFAPNRDFAVRQFRLTYGKQDVDNTSICVGARSRVVYQYHFIKWPDRSIPEEPKLLVELFLSIRKKQFSITNPGPIIVHCSAGIGRTGTFIIIGLIIDNILNKGKDYKVNLLDMVSNIRKCRAGMVQLDSQYIFIENVITNFVKKLKAKERVYENC